MPLSKGLCVLVRRPSFELNSLKSKTMSEPSNKINIKPRPEMISPNTFIAVNQDFETFSIQDRNGKQRNLHMDFLKIVKARVHHQSSKFDKI